MNHLPERIFTMNEEIPTVLMADDSVLDGRFTVWLEQRRVKRFHVSGWKTAWDSFHWAVDVPRNALYSVTALILVHSATIRLTAPSSSLERRIETGPTGWNRMELGAIHLRAGMNELVLSAPDPGEGIELLSLELFDTEKKTRLENDALASRADTRRMRDARYGLQFHWTSMSTPSITSRHR